jgi:hypothetical protein
VEESDEELSRDQGIDDDENHWNPNGGKLISVFGAIFEDQEAGASIESTDSKHSNEDKEASQNVSEVELQKMLQVENEAIPGTLAVWVTRDGHKSIGHRVKVFNQILKARDEAFKEAADAHNDSILSSLALRSADECVNHNSEHEHNGVEKGAKSNGARVLEVGNGHAGNNASTSSLISVRREVELCGSDHVDKLGLFTNE